MQVPGHLLSPQAEAVDQQASKVGVLAAQQQGISYTLLVSRTPGAANPAAAELQVRSACSYANM
jgi:hypothetical protein